MLSVWLLLVFVLGAGVGRVLNVAVRRLPYEKSLLWPGGRCAACLAPIRWYDALPLVGHWLARGRCRRCGTALPKRPFVLEVLTGLLFVGLFYLEVVANVHGLALLRSKGADIAQGEIPWQGWVVFAHHALLLSFLLVASFIDLDHYEIPLPLTMTGTLVGLIGSALWPWPWPAGPLPPAPLPTFPRDVPFGAVPPTQTGLYAWPFWHPLPDGFAPGGNWQTGLMTGVIGVLAGTALLRGVRFVFGLGRGKEGLGVGDADLMMMAGSFLGWQIVVVAFFLSVFPALLIGLVQLAVRGNQELAFGPSLSLGVVITMLCWRWIGPGVSAAFFDLTLVGLMVVAGAGFLFVISVVLRLIRGGGGQETA